MTFFEEALYSQGSIPEVLQRYSELLQNEGGNENLLHANKLLEYKGIVSKKSHATLRQLFNAFYDVLNKDLPKLRFRIAGRRKSLISVEQKIRRNISLNKSLDLIRDMLGVRIILLNGTEDDCYTVLEKLISYSLEHGFSICNEENSHNSDPESLPDTLSPFYYGITNYIGCPKENGYQSLHAIFRNASGFCFEVQVRNFEMHCNAVNGSAEYLSYKDTKYERLKFDRAKINIPGYLVFPDGSVMDLIGIEHSLEVLQRNKSF